MGSQKMIAAQILERNADYLLVLKANHGEAFLAVKEWQDRIFWINIRASLAALNLLSCTHVMLNRVQFETHRVWVRSSPFGRLWKDCTTGF
jgi:hypothetical protein